MAPKELYTNAIRNTPQNGPTGAEAWSPAAPLNTSNDPDPRAGEIDEEVTMRRKRHGLKAREADTKRRQARGRQKRSPLRFGDQTGALNCPRHNGVFRIIAFSVLRPIQRDSGLILCHCLSPAGYGSLL